MSDKLPMTKLPNIHLCMVSSRGIKRQLLYDIEDILQYWSKAGSWVQQSVRDNESNICFGRDALSQKFIWDTDAEYQVWLDDDMDLVGGKVIHRLIAQNCDIVSALYHKKRQRPDEPPSRFTIKKFQREDSADDSGLIEVWGAGTGCMVIHRRVIERMWDIMPKYMFEDEGKEHWSAQLYTHEIITDEWTPKPQYTSDDMGFCYRARKCGFQVYVDCGAVVGHRGETRFPLGFTPEEQTHLMAESPPRTSMEMKE